MARRGSDASLFEILPSLGLFVYVGDVLYLQEALPCHLYSKHEAGYKINLPLQIVTGLRQIDIRFLKTYCRTVLLECFAKI